MSTCGGDPRPMSAPRPERFGWDDGALDDAPGLDVRPISEKISEKKRRGRPRLLHPELRAIYAQDQSYASERTIQNTSYHLRAVALLHEEPWAAWLIGYTSKEGKPGQLRK